jgi:nucleoside phosphorylase
MSKGIPHYFAHSKYNITPDDITRLILHCESKDIHNRVIITPDWSEDFLGDIADKIVPVAVNHVYEISYKKKRFTLVRSGIGAPLTGDVVLALSCTPCDYLIFTGSFGGLTEELAIGDLMTITESISGDGYSNYLKEGEISPRAFLKPARPDARLNKTLEEHTVAISAEKGIALHKGRIFSSDTIVAQFFHLEQMTEQLDCMGIEMETAAVFNTAALVGIPATALLIVSDVIPGNKSLFSGRTEVDRERYQHIKRSALSKIILDTLSDERLR